MILLIDDIKIQQDLQNKLPNFNINPIKNGTIEIEWKLTNVIKFVYNKRINRYEKTIDKSKGILPETWYDVFNDLKLDKTFC